MAEGRLTTHVLDTARGKPAAGVKIMLYRVSGNSHRKITEAVTNADGRTDAALLSGKALTEGQYELVFCAGDYLRAQGAGVAWVLPAAPPAMQFDRVAVFAGGRLAESGRPAELAEKNGIFADMIKS